MSDVKLHSGWFRQTLVPAALPLHNVCAGNGSGETVVKPRFSIPLKPFWNRETNAQISAWKRVIFAYTSNFHYRRTLSFLYLLTATGFALLFLHVAFFLFLRLTPDMQLTERVIVEYLGTLRPLHCPPNSIHTNSHFFWFRYPTCKLNKSKKNYKTVGVTTIVNSTNDFQCGMVSHDKQHF